MDNIYDFSGPKNCQQEAAEWLAKLDRGLSFDEQSQLKQWLAQDTQNAAALLEMAELWDRMESLSQLAELFPEKIEQKQRLFTPVAWAASAMLLLAVSIYFWSDFTGINPTEETAINQNNERVFETEVGEQSKVALPDGSTLTLNTNSAIRTVFQADQRSIFLKRGEIHVQVAHDPHRPFNVHVGNKIVQAVGTAFNLELTSDQHIELIVTEGKVRVSVADQTSQNADRSGNKIRQPAEAEKFVAEGEKVILGDAREAVKPIAPEEIQVKLSWKGGNLIFQGESLEDAINEIERYTTVEFLLHGDSLKQTRVAGLFKAGDVEGLLETLENNFNISYQRISKQKIVLTGP